MDICSTGSWPEIDHDSSDSADPKQESEPLSVEEGDCILAMDYSLTPQWTSELCPPSHKG